MTIKELRDSKSVIVKDMEKMLEVADAEERNLSEDEETKYIELEERLAKVKADIEAAEKQDERRAAIKAEAESAKRSVNSPMEAPAIRPNGMDDNVDPLEFKSFGEFLYTVRFNPYSEKIKNLYDAREQSMGNGVEGGFMVPQKFVADLKSIAAPTSIFRPRATVMAPDPAHPDQSVTMPVLNQTSGKNNYGGVSVSWIAEGATKPDTDAELLEVTLTPHELAGTMRVTDKLLRNWQGANAVLTRLFSEAMMKAEEDAFINGNGVGRPLGVLQSPACVNVNRAAANAIAFADVINMMTRTLDGGNYVWIANKNVLPQLANIRDTGNNNLWIQSMSAGIPGTLAGIPLVYYDRLPGLGNRGDLMLVDLTYYLIQDGSGPFVATSEHVYFAQNKTVIKTFQNVDGQPWLSEPIVGEGDTTQTMSPFVILDTP